MWWMTVATLHSSPYRTLCLGSPSYMQSEQSILALCAPQDAHTRLLFFFAAQGGCVEALQCDMCGSAGSRQCCS